MFKIVKKLTAHANPDNALQLGARDWDCCDGGEAPECCVYDGLLDKRTAPTEFTGIRLGGVDYQFGMTIRLDQRAELSAAISASIQEAGYIAGGVLFIDQTPDTVYLRSDVSELSIDALIGTTGEFAFTAKCEQATVCKVKVLYKPSEGGTKTVSYDGGAPVVLAYTAGDGAPEVQANIATTVPAGVTVEGVELDAATGVFLVTFKADQGTDIVMVSDLGEREGEECECETIWRVAP